MPNDVKVRVLYTQISAAVRELPTEDTGTFRLSTMSLPIDEATESVEVAAFHTSAAERLFNAAIRAPIVEDAERTFALTRASVAPKDEDALSMVAALAVTRVPKVLDADKTEALVFVTLVLTVESVEPKDDDALSTFVFVVSIELESDVEALFRLVVSVERDDALARICEESDDEAEPIMLLVPVIADKTEEIGLVMLSTKSLPIDPPVVSVEVAAFQI